MDRISIFGSCVTRDIFRIMGEGFDIKYFARSSMISAMSDPLELNESDIHLTSDFEKRMVLQDFKKNYFESLESFSPETVIIDLIDERYDLLKFENSYVVQTYEFEQANLGGAYPFEHVPRKRESTHRLWEMSCLQFIEKLKDIVSVDKIVLHEAYWSKEYVQDGTILQFPNQKEISVNNQLLARYYNFIKTQFPEIRVVSETPLGSSSHDWGISPFHYTDAHYKRLFERLQI